MIPREPTSDECTAHAHIGDGWYAIWYPQMGGYVGKAVIQLSAAQVKEDDCPCFDAYVWHDGEFPFGDDRDSVSYEAAKFSRQRGPIHLHHCDPEQFVNFGQSIMQLMGKAR